MLQSSLYSVTVVYFQEHCQTPNGERMGQQQRCHNCRQQNKRERMIHNSNSVVMINVKRSVRLELKKRRKPLDNRQDVFNIPLCWGVSRGSLYPSSSNTCCVIVTRAPSVLCRKLSNDPDLVFKDSYKVIHIEYICERTAKEMVTARIT